MTKDQGDRLTDIEQRINRLLIKDPLSEAPQKRSSRASAAPAPNRDVNLEMKRELNPELFKRKAIDFEPLRDSQESEGSSHGTFGIDGQDASQQSEGEPSAEFGVSDARRVAGKRSTWKRPRKGGR